MCIQMYNCRPIMVIEKNNLTYDKMLKEIMKGNRTLATFPNSAQYLYFDECRMKGVDFATGNSSKPWLKDNIKKYNSWFTFKYTL